MPTKPPSPDAVVLADLVDLTDPDAAIEALLDAPEREFDVAVRAYLRGATVGSEVMRSEELAVRTFEALDRLAQRYGRMAAKQAEPERSSSLGVLHQIRRERRAIYPLVQEAPETMGLTMFSDLVPLDDVDDAVDKLLDMSEAEFDRAVVVWLLGGRAGAEIMREPDVIDRTFDALSRLRDRLEDPALSAQLALPPDDVVRLDRIVREERSAVRTEMHRQRAEQQGASLTSRAHKALATRPEHREELLAIKRQLREAAKS